MSNKPNTQALFGNRWLLLSVLLLLPFVLQPFGNAWIRIADMSLLYVLLALGLNIVVGYAGLLDLGYVAFFGRRSHFRTGISLFQIFVGSKHSSVKNRWQRTSGRLI